MKLFLFGGHFNLLSILIRMIETQITVVTVGKNLQFGFCNDFREKVG